MGSLLSRGKSHNEEDESFAKNLRERRRQNTRAGRISYFEHCIPLTYRANEELALKAIRAIKTFCEERGETSPYCSVVIRSRTASDFPGHFQIVDNLKELIDDMLLSEADKRRISKRYLIDEYGYLLEKFCVKYGFKFIKPDAIKEKNYNPEPSFAMIPHARLETLPPSDANCNLENETAVALRIFWNFD